MVKSSNELQHGMTDGSIELSKALHASDNSYGLSAAYKMRNSLKGRLEVPKAISNASKLSRIHSVLDYGTGQGGLVSLLKDYEDLNGVDIQGFDPAVEKFSKRPDQIFDIVTCIDVLEHIERDAIVDVIKDISELLNGFLFFAIDLIPARKILMDGRNAHIMLAPADWWSQQISARFSFTRFVQVGETSSGVRSPVHLVGWASNDRFAHNAANTFLDSIEVLQKRWVLLEDGRGGVQFHD